MKRIEEKKWLQNCRNQKSQDNLSAKQKLKVRKYDRNRKHEQRASEKEMKECGLKPSVQSTVKTPYIREKSSEIRDKLPKNIESKFAVLQHAMKQIQGQTHLSKRRIGNNKENVYVNRQLRQIAVLKKQNRKNEAEKLVLELLEIYGSIANVSLACGETPRVISRIFSKDSKPVVDDLYTRKLKDQDKRRIVEFYEKEGISKPLPYEKYANQQFLSQSLKETYKEYVEFTQDEVRTVSFLTFAKYRPSNVKVVGKTPHIICTCDKCDNLIHKAEKLRHHGLRMIPLYQRNAIEKTWCDFLNEEHYGNEECKKKFPKKECVERRCPECGIQKLKEEKNSVVTPEFKEKIATWFTWRNVEVEPKKHRMWSIPTTDTLGNLLEEYLEELQGLSQHFFYYNWMSHQFNTCMESLADGEVLLVHDFAQNLLLKHQREPQTMHWDHDQVTLHPTIAYFSCENNCGHMVKEEFFHITPDKKHEWQAVEQFERTTIDYLERSGVKIKKIHEFTDQAPTQYKSCTTFNSISKMKIPTCQHFFGTRHGKILQTGKLETTNNGQEGK